MMARVELEQLRNEATRLCGVKQAAITRFDMHEVSVCRALIAPLEERISVAIFERAHAPECPLCHGPLVVEEVVVGSPCMLYCLDGCGVEVHP